MKKKKHILFISHDANRAGAQILLLDAMRYLKSEGHQISLLILEEWGNIFEGYEDEFNVTKLPKKKKKGKLKELLFAQKSEEKLEVFIQNHFGKRSIDLIYANTIASAQIAPRIKSILGVPLISHIHELAFSISMYSNKKDSKTFLSESDAVIACSDAVAKNLLANYVDLGNKLHTVHSFVDNELLLQIQAGSDTNKVKTEFAIPNDKVLIGGCGNAEWRKGVDVFINIVKLVKGTSLENRVHFVWIGMQNEGEYYEKIVFDLEKMGVKENVSLVPPTSKAKEIINALDIFFVSSREDPFPLVMLEAALCKKPILGYEQTGGCSEFVQNECGLLAPYLDNKVLVQNLEYLVNNTTERESLGQKAQEKVLRNFGYVKSMKLIESIISSF